MSGQFRVLFFYQHYFRFLLYVAHPFVTIGMVKLKLAGAKAIGISAPKKKRLSCDRTSVIDGHVCQSGGSGNKPPPAPKFDAREFAAGFDRPAYVSNRRQHIDRRMSASIRI